MADISPALSAFLLAQGLLDTADSTPQTYPLYLSLHTGDPGSTGAAEVGSGAPYARAPVEFSLSGGVLLSNDAQAFSLASANISYFGVWDSASGGNYLCGGPLTSPLTGVTNVSFAIGAVQLGPIT